MNQDFYGNGNEFYQVGYYIQCDAMISIYGCLSSKHDTSEVRNI